MATERPAPEDGSAVSAEKLTVRELNKIHEESITHHSTWMLVRTNTDEEKKLATDLLAMTGNKVMPIRLKIRMFDGGEEVELPLYSSLTLNMLLTKLTDMTGLTPETMRIKAVQDGRVRRLDT